ncbi:fam-b protein [Plasmodium yoelii]|uniref:Fam-b protein n=2 Tax=Plasmodium yoelii TaxID=5861 RepID=A0AAE9WL63_PLAYO|nr:fam-b protein [Plasmodium yoelii]WBY54414.1 fam-b protein [Plasmodium yoelii yoelii]VTZ71433.1 fam-b protein [Plasmodium yoelii]|eukprot:XP_034493328.1 fam-b protein [Plasmodium yoelii]
MRVSILKYVFFSIIICSFEYAKNELYFANDRGIYLERNVINFRNDRILADVDDQFDLNGFYKSTLSLASQLSDCTEGNKEIAHLQNIIDSYIKKHKESNTLPDLNNLDKKTKKLVNELRTELEKIKKELDNKMNGELAMQPIHDKRIIKKDENSSVSEHEDFKQLESFEKKLRTKNDKFKVEYCEIKFSKKYMGLKINKKLTKKEEKLFKSLMVFSVIILLLMIASGTMKLLLLFAPAVLLIFRSCRRIRKYCFKLWEI